jgi:hypothetical protein
MEGLHNVMFSPLLALTCRFVPNQPLPFHQLSPVSETLEGSGPQHTIHTSGQRLLLAMRAFIAGLACKASIFAQEPNIFSHPTCTHGDRSQHVCLLHGQGDVVLLSREARPQGMGRGGAAKSSASPVDADTAFEAVILDYRWGSLPAVV